MDLVKSSNIPIKNTGNIEIIIQKASVVFKIIIKLTLSPAKIAIPPILGVHSV
jgi:hypothetical protein